MDEPTLIAFIQSVDKKPNPITGIVDAADVYGRNHPEEPPLAVVAKRKYRTRALKVDA